MTSPYLLHTNQQGFDRLAIQAQLYDPSSQQLLKNAGIATGQSILEIGCGTGSMTTWLCQQVGPQGHISAIDLTPQYAESTRERVAAYAQANVQIDDVTQLQTVTGAFDLIYCRMVLHHLQDPKSVLTALYQYLKPGGKIVCEEPPAMQQCFLYPTHGAFERFIQLVLKTFHAHQKDFEIAYTMYGHLVKLGLTVERQQIFQPLVNQEQRQLHLMGLQEISTALLDKHILTSADLAQLTQGVSQALEQAEVVSLYKMFQVIACKHGSR